MDLDLAGRAGAVTREGGEILSSRDGVRWTGEGLAGPWGDNTTFFYDPYRGRWVFSLRTHVPPFGRARGWHAGTDFASAATWTEDEVIPYLGISRDGYHFSVAPEPLLSSSREDGAWDAAYLHAVNGGILPVGEETRIYYTGFSGVSPLLGRHHYAGGSMGLATLRRDGFCALTSGACGEGRATTRELGVVGDHLFLNIETDTGETVATVHNVGTGESERVTVRPGTDNTALGLPLTVTNSGEPAAVVVRFEPTGLCRLYSFWFAAADGASHGYTASGPTR